MHSSSRSLIQSFLHPLDLLLPRQLMTPGMQLTSEPSTPTSIAMNYSAIMEPAGLALFANFPNSTSFPYSVFGLNTSSVRLEDVMHDQSSCNGTDNLNGHSALFFHDGKQLILQSCIANVSVSRSHAFRLDDQTIDFIRLDSDGSIRGYKFDYGNATWMVAYDWFANSSNGVCSVPSVCGPYGICRHSSMNEPYSECSCPALPNDSGLDPHIFVMANKSDSHEGCHLTHPLNCTFGNRTKQQCIAACAQECKCKAAFYRADTGACFRYEQVLSIMRLGNSTQLHTNVIYYDEQTTANTTQKVSTFKLHEQALLQAQSTNVFASLNLTKLGMADGLTNYLGYLKVQNNFVQNYGGGTVAKAGDRRFKALGDEDLFAATLPGQHSVIHFTFAQLQAASGDFKSKLGIGGFGSVYKGTLPNGSVVAIKQLESAIRSDKEFECQVVYLSSLNHPNLVRLTGFSNNGSRHFIVSEYMQNGSLDAWLFYKAIGKDSSSSSPLDWVTRFKIALDVAKGLAFLHQSNLVHMDVKPQNILLDEKFVAKLSDYGLSRLMDQEDGSLIMHMRGMPGYMAPEWVQHACATEKGDVYSYGMVLMEMLGGRKNVDLSQKRENWYFPILAAKMLKENKVLEVLDEKLTKCKAMGEAECEQARKLMLVAFWCIVENPSKRPDMGSILSMLQGHVEVPEPPLPLHFDGHNVHNTMCSYDNNQQFYYNQSGSSSSPSTCFNISFASEPLPTSVYSSWSSNGGKVDDCTLLLPAHE
ncbi:hypothetical protein GOP47_0029286 [Adiantum capillus-veneris]|nr:hypothetical protein GOP47_0029286 [Adiantum capillus-veneris]